MAYDTYLHINAGQVISEEEKEQNNNPFLYFSDKALTAFFNFNFVSDGCCRKGM
jgi:hypothetical protein